MKTLSTLLTAVLLSCCATLDVVHAQPNNFVSASDRFKTNFNRSVDVDFQQSQFLRRASGASNFLGSTVSPPGASLTSASPPGPRQASSLGTGLTAPSSKPFSNISTRPTVSPYMNLFRTDLDGGDDLNYQTLVRPQLQQQRINRQASVRAQQIDRRINALSARNPYTARAPDIYPTGHAAVRLYYSHYYRKARGAP